MSSPFVLSGQNRAVVDGKLSTFDHFVPLLLQVFGIRWFEEGSLSIEFLSDIPNEAQVKAVVEYPSENGASDGDASGGMTINVWLVLDSTVVATGTASVGSSRITSKSDIYKHRKCLNTANLTFYCAGVDSHVFKLLEKVSSAVPLGVGQKSAPQVGGNFTQESSARKLTICIPSQRHR